MIRFVFIFLIGFNIFLQSAFSQSFDSKAIIEEILSSHATEKGGIPGEFPSYFIRDFHLSRSSGIWHYYINQTIEGIPVDLAVSGIHLTKNGKLLYFSDGFIAGSESPPVHAGNIQPEEAIKVFARFLGIEDNFQLSRTEKKSFPNEVIYHPVSFSRSEIIAGLCYKSGSSGQLSPAWKIEFVSNSGHESWTAYVHADSGELMEYFDGTIYCSFEGAYLSHERDASPFHRPATHHKPDDLGNTTSGQYRVFPLPVESPIFGEHILVAGPDSNQASPFGWHDTDGISGPEFTITKGNNVHAFDDQDGDEASADNEPDGGEGLIFDFPFDPSKIPQQSLEAIVTNLFYTNNFLHDFSYRFGFDESSGNFQENNYGRGGDEGDYVIAQALAFENDGDGQQLTNNANFISPRDGNHGIMNMFLWNLSASANRIQITSPEQLSSSLESSEARFGTPVGTVPISAKVVITDDGVSHLTDACHDIINDEELDGNIALIDRGICEFGSKVLNAEQNGAIAALICNVAGVNGGTGDELLSGGMGAGVDGSKVSIPSLFLKKSDCDLIKMVIDGGSDVIVNLELVNPPDGPSQLSSSLDNGIISHEYAHGISTRLTGGESSSACLNNDEQMGEGWSDFFALVLTHRQGDSGSDPRGIGNYVIKANPNGRGIRRFPYTTDMAINPLTYNSIRGTTTPHSLGEVWAACLWDMYWQFIDLYGFDPSWEDENSGNYRAVQLVMEGMKFQKCSPGFVDGRLGILISDQTIYGGQHQCLIWEVFARRGVGYDADQGSAFDRNDNEEGFEPLPTCIKELKIRKSASDVVQAGEEIEVEVQIINHKENSLSGVFVTDKLEDGLSFNRNLSEYPVILEGQNVSFEIGTLQSLDEVVLNYTLVADPLKSSVRVLFNDFEEGAGTTLVQFPLQTDNYEWQLVNFDAYSGTQSWYIPNDTTILDQALVTAENILVSGESPVLRFWHMYETEFGFDGGFLEVSTDGGLTWSQFREDQFLKNGYNSNIDFFTFAIPEQKGFTGNSGGWIETFVNLDDFKSKEILIRFRFGCDTNGRPSGENKGWYIDDFEILDLISYRGEEVCVSSAEGDVACDGAITLIQSAGETTPVIDLHSDGPQVHIYPNPVKDILYLEFHSGYAENLRIDLISMEGKRLMRREFSVPTGMAEIPLEIAHLSEGVYWIRIESEKSLYTLKIVKI